MKVGIGADHCAAVFAWPVCLRALGTKLPYWMERDFSFTEICSSVDVHRCLGEFCCSWETQVFDGHISIETFL